MNAFLVCAYFLSPKSFLINYILIFKKKSTQVRRLFFKVKCYRTELISENLVYWYGPKNLPTNIQYKS